MNIGFVVAEINRMLELLCRACTVAEFGERESEIVTALSVIRINSRSTFEMFSRRLIVAVFSLQDSVEIENVKVVRLGAEQSPRQRLGRGALIVQNQNAKVELLRVEIAGM